MHFLLRWRKKLSRNLVSTYYRLYAVLNNEMKRSRVKPRTSIPNATFGCFQPFYCSLRGCLSFRQVQLNGRALFRQRWQPRCFAYASFAAFTFSGRVASDLQDFNNLYSREYSEIASTSVVASFN